MKLSARNILTGRVLEITKGATTSHVTVDLGENSVTASITNEAVEDLSLEVGQEASVIIKASDVMVGIDS